jgi:hypothetical protein
MQINSFSTLLPWMGGFLRQRACNHSCRWWAHHFLKILSLSKGRMTPLGVKVRDAQGHEFTSRPLHLGGAKSLVGGLGLAAIPEKRMDLTKRTMEPHCPGTDS